MSTLNHTIVGASSESYKQRISCLRNFSLVTGFDAPDLCGRAEHYSFILRFTVEKYATGDRRVVLGWY